MYGEGNAFIGSGAMLSGRTSEALGYPVMADFFFQTMMTMADTYGRATKYNEQVEEMKKFAHDFYEKFKAKQLKENKAD